MPFAPAATAARIAPVASYIVATEPLGADRANALIPRREAACDNNFFLDYFRLSADHRMLFGGRTSSAGASPDALGERHDEFMRLKVEGVRECGELLVVALADGRERHVFGRRTLPEMDLASAACAIQNMWLAARAEGLGMGWVSLFDVDALRRLLAMPDGATPIAVLCLGHVDAFYAKPMLEQERWATRMPLEACLYENGWDAPPTSARNT